MSFKFEVPNSLENSTLIELDCGSSTFIIGANGSGKTRLAAQAERQWGAQAHRISAHRSLNLDPSVAKISAREALNGLRFGFPNVENENRMHFRKFNRWNSKDETFLLNDFDFLIQALFADQSNIALRTHNAAHAGTLQNPEQTSFQKLSTIWNRILPHLTLKVTGDNIKVSAGAQQPYSAAEMSDGERSIFYVLGQVLVAQPNSVLIFDEPELHIHRAILSRLWDEIELVRPDCAFLVITHDLDFVASRAGKKFIICSYQMPNKWEIEEVPDDTGFSEEVTTLILGSRKPILFVEGTGASLDLAIYRACYPEWTVMPRGACEDVIHAVATMRHNASLTRIKCAGLVDADDYQEEDKRRLASFGVAVLPVSEIENLFLLPDIATAILEEEDYQGQDLQEKLDKLTQEVLTEVRRPGSIEETVLRYCRRRIDRTLKNIDLKDATTSSDLAVFYTERTAALNVESIAEEARERIEGAVEKCELPALLANFDNKALLSIAAKNLKNTSKSSFESWITRAMRNPKTSRIKSALNKTLPQVKAE